MGTQQPLTTAKNYHLSVVCPDATTASPFKQNRETTSSRRVILSLGTSSDRGVPAALQIGDEDRRSEIAIAGWLPPAPRLIAAYEQWQRIYRQVSACDDRFVSRLSVPAVQVTNVSVQEIIQSCYCAGEVLTQCINQWLNSEIFRPVRETLLAYCHPSERIRFTLKTDDLQIQKLPLHQWDWFERYPLAELAIGSTTYTPPHKVEETLGSHLRVLAVLGNSRGIDVETDLSLLINLPNASVNCLREPRRSLLNEALWDDRWDIILFAGHSECGQPQKFKLNKLESLSLNELRYGLKRAIARNLRLLILNTCDSLTLLQELSNISLPATIAMRQPVPDVVAQTFLRYFLTAFSAGQSLSQSVREARQKLQGIEHQFPFSSSIPVLHQTL